jgi:mRNA-degrading endonuclease HigB of HigAB toxin-antitoxin module
MIIANKEILDVYVRKHVIVKNSIEKWVKEVKGNDYRLIAIVLYVINVVEIRWMGTHAEYNKIKKLFINLI